MLDDNTGMKLCLFRCDETSSMGSAMLRRPYVYVGPILECRRIQRDKGLIAIHGRVLEELYQFFTATLKNLLTIRSPFQQALVLILVTCVKPFTKTNCALD